MKSRETKSSCTLADRDLSRQGPAPISEGALFEYQMVAVVQDRDTILKTLNSWGDFGYEVVHVFETVADDRLGFLLQRRKPL